MIQYMKLYIPIYIFNIDNRLNGYTVVLEIIEEAKVLE